MVFFDTLLILWNRCGHSLGRTLLDFVKKQASVGMVLSLHPSKIKLIHWLFCHEL